ncbi:MAG: aminoglycoside phosphotransferase family protein, partial [Ktedonobacteraceae bacterium]
IPELKEKRCQLLACDVTEVQNHRRKQLVSCQISYLHAAEKRTKKASLVVKFYGEQGGDTAYRALQQLWQANFKHPSRYRVPRPYGYTREQAILIQARVTGTEWIKLLLDSQYDSHRATDRAALWLLRLQQHPIDVLMITNKANRDAAVVTMNHQIQELATSFPSAAARLEAVGQQLLQQHRTLLGGSPLVPSHGDYHPGNVLLTTTTTTVIDFDAFGLRDAAFDVGYCIAQLLSMSYFRTGCLAPGAKAAARFWLTYRRHGGQAAWSDVVSWGTSTLLHVLHYTLCAMKAARSDMLPWWLDTIGQWLSDPSPGILDSFSHH